MALSRDSLQFVIVVFPDHTYLLFGSNLYRRILDNVFYFDAKLLKQGYQYTKNCFYSL